MNNEQNNLQNHNPYYIPVQNPNDEISIAEIFSAIWEGKWLIIIVTAISVLVGGLYIYLTPNKFTFSQEIKPISDSEFLAYSELNSIKTQYADADADADADAKKVFFSISKGQLLNLFIQELRERKLYIDAIKKTEFIDRNSYKDEQAYLDTLQALALEFKLNPPLKDEKNPSKNKEFWNIEFKGNDEEKAKEIFKVAFILAEEKVKSLLTDNFSNKIAITKINQHYLLEDIDRKIDDAIFTYDENTANRLAYLREQASIARSLGIAKNTIEAQSFNTSSNTVVTTIQGDKSYYLRGYEAIEKEIALIQEREEKNRHIPELVNLYEKKRIITNSPTLERAEKAFNNSPLATDIFKAANTDLLNLETKSQKKPQLILALSFILGGMIGLFVLLVKNAVKNQKKSRSNEK